MACGTPVVGTRRGSFPELITHGVDGFLGTSVDEMAGYVNEIAKIDRKACRKTVEERFSKTRMAEGYLKAYEKILKNF
jgi:glycosyltransferase involved in cell wall biosynthesis